LSRTYRKGRGERHGVKESHYSGPKKLRRVLEPIGLDMDGHTCDIHKTLPSSFLAQNPSHQRRGEVQVDFSIYEPTQRNSASQRKCPSPDPLLFIYYALPPILLQASSTPPMETFTFYPPTHVHIIYKNFLYFSSSFSPISHRSSYIHFARKM
jgi:hypothetical protein